VNSPSPPTRLLVSVVNYRTPQLIVDCLVSLEPEVRALGNVQVVVADNGSNDGSAERIDREIARRGWGDWVRLLALPTNGGFAAGNNAVIRPALESTDPPPPDYLMLLNSDTVVHRGALGALIEFMDARPDVGIAGSRLEDPDGSEQQSCYRFRSFWSELDAGLKLGVVTRLLRRHVVALPKPQKSGPIDWVAGASMIVRRQVFRDVGLLDEGYFLYFEEEDFSLKARHAGWSCWYVPASRIVHLVGKSTGVTNRHEPARRRPRYWFDSRRRYYVKNHGRLYAWCADAAFFAGFSLWRIRRVLQRKPDRDPPYMWWDFLRYTLSPARHVRVRDA
jgi:GT2 family glycosyltransferase